ncbi:hypothetical protein NL676_028303 [Syzygium grande]|nr:hypothetical protein NL676_028303 [Syzygium grande]
MARINSAGLGTGAGQTDALISQHGHDDRTVCLAHGRGGLTARLGRTGELDGRSACTLFRQAPRAKPRHGPLAGLAGLAAVGGWRRRQIMTERGRQRRSGEGGDGKRERD